MPSRRVQDSTFAVLANGDFDSPPASGLIDYLRDRGARRLVTVFHPLSPEDGNEHLITTYEPGSEPSRRVVRLPSRPPYTYPLDFVVPPRIGAVDGWFAFNNLLAARGLLERRRGRAGKVVYWAVDFVPDRFGAGSAMTKVYDALDGYCCRAADLRVELSSAALEGRDERHGLGPANGAPRHIAPVGAWLDRIPVCPDEAINQPRLIFVSHLVERMGGTTAIAAVGELARRGVPVTLDIAGRGPSETEMRADAARLGVEDRVVFHGFIADHQALERLVAGAAIALAPYSTRVESFTRFADPSKLKAYLAAGLPILVTEVPPNAVEIARDGGAEVLADDPIAFADAIERLIADHAEWSRRRAAALAYVKRFDWATIVEAALAAAGFSS